MPSFNAYRMKDAILNKFVTQNQVPNFYNMASSNGYPVKDAFITGSSNANPVKDATPKASFITYSIEDDIVSLAKKRYYVSLFLCQIDFLNNLAQDLQYYKRCQISS